MTPTHEYAYSYAGAPPEPPTKHPRSTTKSLQNLMPFWLPIWLTSGAPSGTLWLQNVTDPKPCPIVPAFGPPFASPKIPRIRKFRDHANPREYVQSPDKVSKIDPKIASKSDAILVTNLADFGFPFGHTLAPKSDQQSKQKSYGFSIQFSFPFGSQNGPKVELQIQAWTYKSRPSSQPEPFLYPPWPPRSRP